MVLFLLESGVLGCGCFSFLPSFVRSLSFFPFLTVTHSLTRSRRERITVSFLSFFGLSAALDSRSSPRRGLYSPTVALYAVHTYILLLYRT